MSPARADGKVAVFGPGDGTFELYRTEIEQHLGTGRFGIDLSALVLQDPTTTVPGAVPEDRQRPQSMAGRLFSSLPDRRSEFETVQCLTHGRDRLAFSADGLQLAIWRDDSNRLCIVDTKSGDERLTFTLGGLNKLNSLCFTPDSATLAFGTGDNEVQLWHLRTPRNPEVLRGHTPKEAWSVAFAPDGQTIASSGDDHHIRLWERRDRTRNGNVTRPQRSRVIARLCCGWAHAGKRQL